MNAIMRFFDWLTAGVAEGERMRRETYLGQATDHCDLEVRMRELDHEPLYALGWS